MDTRSTPDVMAADEAHDALRIYGEVGAVSPGIYVRALCTVAGLHYELDTIVGILAAARRRAERAHARACDAETELLALRAELLALKVAR